MRVRNLGRDKEKKGLHNLEGVVEKIVLRKESCGRNVRAGASIAHTSGGRRAVVERNWPN